MKGSGSDSGNGSWTEPFRTASHAVNAVPAGSTIYLHDIQEGSFSSPGARAIYWNNGDASSSLNAQFAVAPYPGSQPKIIAQKAVENYRVQGMVVSKLDVYASNYLSVDTQGQPEGNPIHRGATYGILTSRNGRVIGNRVGDIPGGCASKFQGAIVGNKDWVGNNKILGNEIYDYGCNGSSKLHHTTYLSIRASDDPRVEPWEWGYNYLRGNKAKFGIHNYDEGAGCGDLSGPLLIHNNVIVDQAGAGISVGSACGWSMDAYIENNVLINVGLAAAWDGVDPSTSDGAENGGIAIRDADLRGTFFIRNNLIYKWSVDDQGKGGEGCLTFNSGGDHVEVVWKNNICYTEQGLPFVGAGFRAENKLDNVQGNNNIWFSETRGDGQQVPSWDTQALNNDPLVRVSNSRVVIDDRSPALGRGSEVEQSLNSISAAVGVGVQSSAQSRDIYGNVRSFDTIDIGPVSINSAPNRAIPNPPSSVTIRN